MTDEQLATAAAKKRAAGQRLNRAEEAALRRVLKAREEAAREKTLAECPKKIYLRLAGRQAKVVNEQADRYGLPLRGEVVNLFEIIRAFHDLLPKLGSLIGHDGPALERLREEKFRLAQLDRRERESQLLPRDAVHERLALVASILRRAGETLARRCGPEAHQILNEALDEADREVAALAPGAVDGSGLGDVPRSDHG